MLTSPLLSNASDQETRRTTGLSLHLHPPLRRGDEADVLCGYRDGHAVVEERDDATGSVEIDASRTQDPVRLRALVGQQTEQQILGADNVGVKSRFEGCPEHA